MPRSQANKAKGASRNGARPRAMISARAKLVGVGTAAGASSGYGTDKKTDNVMRLTLDVSIGAPRRIPTWDEYKQEKRWEIERNIERAVQDATPKKAKAAKATKPKKGEAAAAAAVIDAAPPKVDAQALRNRIKSDVMAELKVEYDKRVATIATSNNRMAHRAAAFGMFMALRGSDLQLTLAPLQGGMVELFGAEEQHQLASGEE